MVDIHEPLQTKGETRCPGGVCVFCFASRTRIECPRHNESSTLNVDRHYIGSVRVTTHQEKEKKKEIWPSPMTKRHNNTWVEPLAMNCTTSSTRQREQVWQKCNKLKLEGVMYIEQTVKVVPCRYLDRHQCPALGLDGRSIEFEFIGVLRHI